MVSTSGPLYWPKSALSPEQYIIPVYDGVYNLVSIEFAVIYRTMKFSMYLFIVIIFYAHRTLDEFYVFIIYLSIFSYSFVLYLKYYFNLLLSVFIHNSLLSLYYL